MGLLKTQLTVHSMRTINHITVIKREMEKEHMKCNTMTIYLVPASVNYKQLKDPLRSLFIAYSEQSQNSLWFAAFIQKELPEYYRIITFPINFLEAKLFSCFTQSGEYLEAVSFIIFEGTRNLFFKFF